MNKNFLLIFIFSLTMMVFSAPSSAHALTVYTHNQFSDLEIGKESVIKIFINTEGKEINVIEGKIKIEGPVKVSQVNTDGSIFSMWPEEPKIPTEQEINFTGGVEGGVYGRDLRLFNITVSRLAQGEIKIKPVDIVAYLNDGNGTKIKNTNTDITVDSSEKIYNNNNETKNTISKILPIVLILVVLFTLINILRKIFKAKNK